MNYMEPAKERGIKLDKNLHLETYFEEPIIHKEIQGDRVYVPLDLNRAWNKNIS